MSKARIEILRLVKEGKITEEEADRILSGMEEGKASDAASDRTSGTGSGTTSDTSSSDRASTGDEGARSPGFGEALSQLLDHVGDVVRSSVDDAVGAAQRVFEEHRPDTEGVAISSDAFDLPAGSRLKVQPAVRVSFGGTSKGGHVVIRSTEEARARILRGEAVEVHRSGNDYFLTWAKGNLELEVPRTVSSLDARSMGGDLEVQQFAGPMSLETMGGEVRAFGVRSSLRARSVGGRVRIADLDLQEGFSTIRTTGGNVTVEITRRSSVAIQVSTVGGTIHFPQGTESESAGRARRRASAVIGDGKAELRIDTLGGDVEIRMV